MILCVTGGRDHPPFHPLREKLFLARLVKRITFRDQRFTELWQGGAKGADTEARLWAESHGLRNRTFEAEWGKHGKRAGRLRNQRMRDALLASAEITLVVAFPGGTGTAHMVEICQTEAMNLIFYTPGAEHGPFPDYYTLLPF